jgi:hypothetical protein
MHSARTHSVASIRGCFVVRSCSNALRKLRIFFGSIRVRCDENTKITANEREREPFCSQPVRRSFVDHELVFRYGQRRRTHSRLEKIYGQPPRI